MPTADRVSNERDVKIGVCHVVRRADLHEVSKKSKENYSMIGTLKYLLMGGFMIDFFFQTAMKLFSSIILKSKDCHNFSYKE